MSFRASLARVSYELVFDAAHSPIQFKGIALGTAFTVLGALLWWKQRSPGLPAWTRFLFRTASSRVFGRTFFFFSLFWTVLVTASTLNGYFRVRGALASGNTLVTEGVVADFVPMPYTGHGSERFTVSDVPFSFSDYVTTPGFNQTVSHGGPLKPGLQVRLHYIQEGRSNLILRAEVQREQRREQ